MSLSKKKKENPWKIYETMHGIFFHITDFIENLYLDKADTSFLNEIGFTSTPKFFTAWRGSMTVELRWSPRPFSSSLPTSSSSSSTSQCLILLRQFIPLLSRLGPFLPSFRAPHYALAALCVLIPGLMSYTIVVGDASRQASPVTSEA